MKRMRRAKGQAIVEYIIIIVLVALASITLIGMFSDTLRTKVAGIINTLGGESKASKGDSAVKQLQDMKEDGISLDESGSN